MTKKSNPSAVYNIVKVLTVLLVVIAHSTRMYTPKSVFPSLMQSDFLETVTEYIYLFHMPLFIFISGSVYGLCIQNGKYANPVVFWGNKAKRLLIPYFVFGLFYVAPVMCLIGLTQQNYLSYCIHQIVLSYDARHLWFIAALFWIFVYASIVRKMFMKSHLSRMIVLMISAVLFVLSRIAPVAFQIQSALAYQLFFTLGTVFHFYYDKMAAIFIKLKYLWLLLPVILMGSFFFNPNALVRCVYQVIGIFMVLSLSVYLEKWTKLDKTKWFQCIKDYSMGIFLFHPMLIYVGFYWLGGTKIPPIVLSFAVAIVVTFLSMAFTKILRKIKLGFIMGE